MNTKKLAKQIVKKILNNLEGRCGIGNELEQIDSEIKKEMIDDLASIVQNELVEAVLK